MMDPLKLSQINQKDELLAKLHPARFVTCWPVRVGQPGWAAAIGRAIG